MKFKKWHEKNKHLIYNDPIGAMEQAFEAGQQQYKSIVKKVDADNLPSDMVWAWCEEGLYLGYIELNDTCEALIIRAYLDTYDEPTHYIEQKDLIKLMSGE